MGGRRMWEIPVQPLYFYYNHFFCFCNERCPDTYWMPGRTKKGEIKIWHFMYNITQNEKIIQGGKTVNKLSKAEHNCKGVVCRASVHLGPMYSKHGELIGIGQYTRLRILKRQSCPGCKWCGVIYDSIGELDVEHFGLCGVGSVVHGKLYRVTLCHEQQDPETGMVEDWDLCVEKIDEKRKV